MNLLLHMDCTQAQKVLQQPRRHESHTLAAPDMPDPAVPGHILEGSAGVGAAQEGNRFVEIE